MLELTTEIKSRRFCDRDRDKLYSLLKDPICKKRSECIENLKTYLDDVILGKVLDPDMIYLGEREYCKYRTSSFVIHSEPLGLEGRYYGLPEFKNCWIDLNFNFSSTKFKYVGLGNYKSVDITSMIINICSEDEKETIKNSMYEIAKLSYEYQFYGLGTFIKPDRYGLLFPSIVTWGNLYNKSPEYFEIFYNSLPENRKELKAEEKLILDLKSALGY